MEYDEHSELDNREEIEKAVRRGASISRYESVKQMRKRWLAAGAPKHYKERYEAGKGVTRIWDTAARREALEDKQNPERVKIRVAQAELRIKREKMKKRVR